MTLAKLLEDTAQVLADHDVARERLHSAPAGVAAKDRITFGALGAPASPAALGQAVRLASLPGPAHRKLLEKFAHAGSEMRNEILKQQSVKLFSIIFAQYRPGPAFLPGHKLAPDALDAKVTPGGKTWRDYLISLDPMQPAGFESRVSALARHCPRLDKNSGAQVGSGILLNDGSILTARHVVQEPGWLFGNPAKSGWVRYNQINTAGPPEANIAATRYLSEEIASLDMAIVSQSENWRDTLAASPLASEFGSLPGLPMQTEPLDEAHLKDRHVAVIAHPLKGNTGGDPADIPIVYGDAKLGVKRFMPGFLDDETPIVVEHGQTFLSHDCSTLGGASGGCLVDLLTGKVLGIHVSGQSDLGNRAVPVWILPGITQAPSAFPPN